jgi:RNA polymerase sigma factor (sigma-70 family)
MKGKQLADDISSIVDTATKLYKTYEWTAVSLSDLIAEAKQSTEDNQLGEAVRQQEWLRGSKRLEMLVLRTYARLLHGICKAGQSHPAYEQAYVDLFRYLYYLARKHWGDLERQTAEELAQSALIDLFNTHHKCRSPESFLIFASFCLRAAASTLFRDLKRQHDSLEDLERELFEDSPLTPDLDLHETLDALVAGLRELKASQRQIILLRVIDRLSDRDIATLIGKTQVVVRARRSRALRALRKTASVAALF